MDDIIKDIYMPLLPKNGFIPDPENTRYGEPGQCWRLSESLGEGNYWVYGYKNLFDIKIHDFYFKEDSFMELYMPECLSITYYSSISGEELAPYKRLKAGCVKSYLGGYTPFKAIIHKKIPVRCVGIEIMPAYYEDYLKQQYPGEYSNPQDAFLQVDETTSFPEMVLLLNQVKNYRGTGIAAKLFYEAKVAEAVSLIVERRKKERSSVDVNLSSQDLHQLDILTSYMNDHYAYDLPLERLAKIACMGTTKLKTTFKRLHGLTITEYLQQRRMSQAEHLLSSTNLTIGQVAQTVGYTNASRFAELFQKSTGLLPGEYRKIISK